MGASAAGADIVQTESRSSRWISASCAGWISSLPSISQRTAALKVWRSASAGAARNGSVPAAGRYKVERGCFAWHQGGQDSIP